MARWEPLEARFFGLKGLRAYRCKKCGIICYEGEKEQNNNYRTNLDPHLKKRFLIRYEASEGAWTIIMDCSNELGITTF
jgi:hypothetical protein